MMPMKFKSKENDVFMNQVSLSVMSDSATQWIVAHLAPLTMGFPMQEFWRELPFPPPGALPDPGIEPLSLPSPTLAGGFFTIVSSGKLGS